MKNLILLVTIVAVFVTVTESKKKKKEEKKEHSGGGPCPVCTPLQTARFGFDCNGDFRPTCPRLQKIIRDCREEVMQEDTRQNFFCHFVCMGRKLGVLNDGHPTNETAAVIEIPEIYPLKYKEPLTVKILKCVQENRRVVADFRDRECERWIPAIRCIRQAFYRTCLVHSESITQTQHDNEVDLFVTYAACKNTVRTHGPVILGKFKDCLDKHENGTVTDVFLCQYYKTGIVNADGSVNITRLGAVWGESYPLEIRPEFEDMLEGTRKCVEEFPIGPFDSTNGNIDKRPYFACTQRNFFRVCRPGEYVVPFGTDRTIWQ